MQEDNVPCTLVQMFPTIIERIVTRKGKINSNECWLRLKSAVIWNLCSTSLAVLVVNRVTTDQAVSQLNRLVQWYTGYRRVFCSLSMERRRENKKKLKPFHVEIQRNRLITKDRRLTLMEWRCFVARMEAALWLATLSSLAPLRLRNFLIKWRCQTNLKLSVPLTPKEFIVNKLF